jgi:DNA replication protein DnaC
MDMSTLQQQLKKVKLYTAAQELQSVVESRPKGISLGWLSELLTRELDARRESALQRRIKRAGFPEITSLENFDWSFNPKIQQAEIEELSTLEFIKNNTISLFLGPPGVGKTHIALALGLKAACQGSGVYWASMKKIAREILINRSRNTLDLYFKKILSTKLWIIDDWGVITLNREIAEEVFDLLDRRKQHAAMIMTSNRDISEWGTAFPDLVIANATIDRIFDRAKILVFEGESYRLKGRINSSTLKMERRRNLE